MAVQPSKDQPCLARSSSGLSLLESGRKLFLQSETAKHLLLNTVISQSSCFKKQVTKESESQILSFPIWTTVEVKIYALAHFNSIRHRFVQPCIISLSAKCHNLIRRLVKFSFLKSLLT